MTIMYFVYDWGGIVKWLQRTDGVFMVDPQFEDEFNTLFFCQRVKDLVKSI
jgi:hypothetical protein